MLFAKDFFYSWLAFWLVVGVPVAAWKVMDAFLAWLNPSPLMGLVLVVAFTSALGAVAFAIHEHRKRGGR